MTTGERIRTIREAKGIKQEELAHHLNETQQNVSKLEHDQIDVSLSKLKQIAQYFQVGLFELLVEDHLTFQFTNNRSVQGSGLVINHAVNADETTKLLQENVKILTENSVLKDEKIARQATEIESLKEILSKK
jgi:transcriptional regulator with XRE-family HTH domain